jgi:amidohydrolase
MGDDRERTSIMDHTKTKIQQAVETRSSELKSLSLKIHANPELSFHEHQAQTWLTTPLEKAGFQVERGLSGLPTSFRATWNNGKGPTIAFLAEYDALPKIGHACGHNIIGTSAVGAALALKDAIPDLSGKILVIGTPAEEEGGGKIIMADDGIFDDVDAAMLCHPHKKTWVLRGGLACVDATIQFFGKQSHASSAPEKGISALEALISSYNAIHALRPFFTDDVRINGIITHGGEATNVIPDFAEAKFLMRAATTKRLEEVRQKVYRAIQHSTEAMGARCEITEGLLYAERNNNHALATLFRDNLESMGIEVSDPPVQGGLGSSDIGNVGQVTATIHPYIQIGDVTTHTPEFATQAASEAGMNGLLQASKALAMTAYDLIKNPEAFQSVRNEFNTWKQKQSS